MSKRLIDIISSFLGIVCLLPLFIIISLLILVLSGRPIFFIQDRPGLIERPFRLIKFRTMVLYQEGKAISDEMRMTKFGSFLRSTSLDELPELINVLKGDMSIVGPRPLLMDYLKLYDDNQKRRHEVKPGITGWAQINGRNAIVWEEKFELDVWYVDNFSFILDLKILAITFIKVLLRKNISQKGKVTMEKFTGTKEKSQNL